MSKCGSKVYLHLVIMISLSTLQSCSDTKSWDFFVFDTPRAREYKL